MPSLLVLLAAAFGAAAGAFVPRIAHRLAVASASPPRSTCAGCAQPFPPGLPGWVRAGASCRCRRFPWRTIGGSAAAAGLLGATLGARAELPVLLIAAVAGAVLIRVDLRSRRLPDPVVGALGVAVVVPLTAVAVLTGEGQRAARGGLAAALVGTAYLILALLPGDGLGLGDVKLAAVLGFAQGLLGWPALIAGVVLPHLINGPIALVLLLARRARRRSALPFGPALLVGALLAVATTA